MPHDLTRAGPNALQACLGDDFDRLPETVRRAHVGNVRLTGQARVTRGGALANVLANMMGLPRSSDRVEMTVEGDHLPDRMIWNRRFGAQTFVSCFRLHHERMIELIGPFHLQLRLEVRDHRLRYVLERATLFRIPVPRSLAPDLEAWEGDRDGRYDFVVEVRLSLIGRLVRYEGLLDLQNQAQPSS